MQRISDRTKRILKSVLATLAVGTMLLVCLAAFNLGFTGLLAAILLQVPSMIFVGAAVGYWTGSYDTKEAAAIVGAPIGWVTGSLIAATFGGLASSGQLSYWLLGFLLLLQIAIGIVLGIVPSLLAGLPSQE